MEVAQAELAAADGQIRQAEGAYRQALDELETRVDLRRRNPNVVPQRDIDRLEITVDGQQGAVDAAVANKAALQTGPHLCQHESDRRGGARPGSGRAR